MCCSLCDVWCFVLLCVELAISLLLFVVCCWCLPCGVVCLLLWVLLVVILRVDNLRLTLRVVADLCCDVFLLLGVVRCLVLFILVVIVC